MLHPEEWKQSKMAPCDFQRLKCLFVVCTKMLKASKFCLSHCGGHNLLYLFCYICTFRRERRRVEGMDVSQDSLSGFILQILAQNDPDPLR